MCRGLNRAIEPMRRSSSYISHSSSCVSSEKTVEARHVVRDEFGELGSRHGRGEVRAVVELDLDARLAQTEQEFMNVEASGPVGDAIVVHHLKGSN